MSISWENAVVKNETQELSADPIINSRIKAVVSGLSRSIANLFLEFPTDHNKELVTNFLDSCIKQENISLNTKRVYLIALAYFVREIKKPLELITSSDLKNYLDSMQKSRTEDPDQSWINTQRTMGLPLLKFFKWLSYPDLTTLQRKQLPREKWAKVLKLFELQSRRALLRLQLKTVIYGRKKTSLSFSNIAQITPGLDSIMLWHGRHLQDLVNYSN
jgi:hypothetical protein